MTMIPLRSDLETAIQLAASTEGVSPEQFIQATLEEKLRRLGIPVTIEEIAASRAAFYGSQRGQIRMSEDFDAPLEDFKDYMP